MVEQQPNLIKDNSLLFHYVIIHGLLEAASWLITNGVDIEVRAKYTFQDYVADFTPLHLAIRTERTNIARLLFESGADVNAKTTGELKITALHNAAAIGNLDLIRLLVKHHADLNAKDNIDTRIPLDWAKYFKQEAAIELLQELSNDK